MIMRLLSPPLFSLFFFNATATTEIYTLSLHDALPIYRIVVGRVEHLADRPGDLPHLALVHAERGRAGRPQDRKSTRLNSSHQIISYAVFCLKKKNGIRLIEHNRPNLQLVYGDQPIRQP